MAVFKVINQDRKGKEALYETEQDLYNLIAYLCDRSYSVGGRYIYLVGREGITNQFLYRQKCSGKRLHRRARHFVLAFDSGGMEWQIKPDDISKFMEFFIAMVFPGYQCFWAIHNKYKNRHVHIVINPVCIDDQHIFHMSQADFKKLRISAAQALYWKLGVALESVSYIDEYGKIHIDFDNEYHLLYGNRRYNYTPLTDENGRATVLSSPY